MSRGVAYAAFSTVEELVMLSLLDAISIYSLPSLHSYWVLRFIDLLAWEWLSVHKTHYMYQALTFTQCTTCVHSVAAGGDDLHAGEHVV